jgi:hypothetical protein
MEEAKKLFEKIISKLKKVDGAWNFHTTNSPRDNSIIKTFVDFRVDSNIFAHLILWVRLSEVPNLYKISLLINEHAPINLIGEFKHDNEYAINDIKFMEDRAVVEIAFTSGSYNETSVKLKCNGLSYEDTAKILTPVFSAGK